MTARSVRTPARATSSDAPRAVLHILTPLPSTRTRTCSGAYWTSTRAALQPLFHSTGLASYHASTAAAVGELEADLAAAAAEGVPVDMAAGMCNLALKARAHCAMCLPRCAVRGTATPVSWPRPDTGEMPHRSLARPRSASSLR